MPAMAAPARHGAGPDLADLDDAREALDYWEARAAALPRLAVRDRREAREMAVRSRAWVTEAERAVYGRGLQGALLLMVSEQRLPEPTRHAGRQAAHRARSWPRWPSPSWRSPWSCSARSPERRAHRGPGHREKHEIAMMPQHSGGTLGTAGPEGPRRQLQIIRDTA
jgi:hypothetical protein